MEKMACQLMLLLDGTVYDTGEVEVWKGGNHFGVSAGADLHSILQYCHSNEDKNILKKLIPVGVLKG